MIFRKAIRHTSREPSNRMKSAYIRSCRNKQEKLPLLAPLIAEAQPSFEEIERQRAITSKACSKNMRDLSACHWRDVRRRLTDLPLDVRKALLERYRTSSMPKESGTLSHLLWRGITSDVSADEMPFMAPEERARRIADLNDRARSDDKTTRLRTAYSKGFAKFVAGGFVADEDFEYPHPHLHYSRGLMSIVADRVRNYQDFSANEDPTGERREGYFSVNGVQLRFVIFYISHCSDGLATVPWNNDLSRRWIWIGLADEVADLATATISSGWALYRSSCEVIFPAE